MMEGCGNDEVTKVLIVENKLRKVMWKESKKTRWIGVKRCWKQGRGEQFSQKCVSQSIWGPTPFKVRPHMPYEVQSIWGQTPSEVWRHMPYVLKFRRHRPLHLALFTTSPLLLYEANPFCWTSNLRITTQSMLTCSFSGKCGFKYFGSGITLRDNYHIFKLEFKFQERLRCEYPFTSNTKGGSIFCH